MQVNNRYATQALIHFAEELLQAAGMPRVPAEAVARTLVEGDLLGHDTHGLALLAPYIKKLESGSVTRDGLDFLAPIA
jgi:LDH2 family malate/lactate/ureidoglycolate dehydrogenase